MRRSLWILLALAGVATSLAALESVKTQVEAEERMSEDRMRPVTRFAWETATPWGLVGVSVEVPHLGASATPAELQAWRAWRQELVRRECETHPPIPKAPR